MSFLSSNLVLVAQAAAAEAPSGPWYDATWFKILVVLAVLLVPLALAQLLAAAVRMREYTTKFYAILFAILAGVFIIATGEVRLDIDLNGGTELIYELDQSKKTEDAKVDMEQMIAALRRRIDPAGVKQTRIRKYGAEQIEITIPEIDPTEVDQLKRMISSAGILEFRILASPSKNDSATQQALKLPSHEMDVRAPTFNAETDYTYAEELIEQAQRLGPDEPRFRRDIDGAVAEWVKPDAAQLEEMKTNKRLVTRNNKSEILVIQDRLLARWVKGGLNPEAESESDTRVQPTDTNVSRLRPDGGVDFLVMIDPMNVHGVESASAKPDQGGTGWLVAFNFEADRARRFGNLTSHNQKDEETGQTRQLGIVLDGKLLSAPALQAVISSSGQITGGFTKAETQWLASVLNAGSLPAALSENPISEKGQSPTLGKKTIEQGSRAILISFVAVMLFMPLYYRFGGIVAAFALTLNLVLVLAIMMLFKARFSLPGLAGLVLTVGMAVDANVLIFERIREELNRGSALRMAIRNGFDRATRTIVDANVTTLITGVVLYVVGSEQIKGFAITLILGITMSMFTAIFCSRVIFDVAEKRRWITKLNMMKLFGETSFNFIGKRKIAGVFSIILIAIGLVAVFNRGGDLLSIDFTGGSKLLAVAIKSEDPETLRDKLLEASPKYAESQRPKDLTIRNYSQKKDEESGALTTFDLSSNSFPTSAEQVAEFAFPKATVTENLGTDSYRVALTTSVTENEVEQKVKDATDEYVQSLMLDPRDTSVTVTESKTDNGQDDPIIIRVVTKQPNVDVVRATVTLAFEGLLKSNHLSFDKTSFTAIEAAAVTPAADAAVPGVGDSSYNARPQDSPKTIVAFTTTPVLAQPESGDEAEAADDTADTETADPAATEDAAADPAASVGGEFPVDGAPAVAPVVVRFAGGTKTDLTFDIALNQQTLHRYIIEVMEETGNRGDFEVFNDKVAANQTNRMTEWRLESTLTADATEKLLSDVATKMDGQPVFPSANAMGSLVAGNQQGQAWGALITSLICIVGYIWIRFQRVIFGLAAVVALVHDVLITLGMLALSGYVAQIFFFRDVLLIDDFKISLEILAAFLTIIGYSLNDTIVVFDRIREVRGKSPDLTGGIINKSINQTLSRTVLTSVTTLLVVAILYAMGGSGIHGFAFALVTGVLAGTYSSIFVASPVLLWLSRTGLNVPDDVLEPQTAVATTG